MVGSGLEREMKSKRLITDGLVNGHHHVNVSPARPSQWGEHKHGMCRWVRCG
jgi:hypothetical protein